MFSFLSKILKKNSNYVEKNLNNKLIQNLSNNVISSDGLSFYDFDIYYLDRYKKLEYLIYLPNHGIYIGNQLCHSLDELKNYTISKAPNNGSSTTNLEDSETLVKAKLDDILSFNEIAYSRFIYMSNMIESQYNELDESFKKLLPIDKLIFSDYSVEQVVVKLKSLLPYKDNHIPTKTVSIALQSHLMLPSNKSQTEARLLDKEQIDFITKDFGSDVVTLYGKYNSAKSTVIISRALLELLKTRDKKIAVVTATLLAADLMRKELVSILTCGAINIDLKNIQFLPQEDLEQFVKSKQNNHIDTIFCDDSHLYEEAVLDLLKLSKPQKQTIFLATKNLTQNKEQTVELKNCYSTEASIEYLEADSDTLLPQLLNNIRSKFFNDNKRSMIICKDQDVLVMCKNALDEYLGVEAQITDDNFSLQYHDFSNIFLTNLENSHGVHTPHVFYINRVKDANLGHIISRASDSVTIITYSGL